MVVNFFLKEAGKSNPEQRLIFLWISLYGKYIKVSTKETIPFKNWDKKKQRVKSQYPGSVELNIYLDALENKATKAYYKCLEENKTSFEEIKEAIRGAVTRKKDKAGFFEAFQEFIEIRETEKSPNTVKKYKTLYKLLESFQSQKKNTLNFDAINQAFFESFKTFLIKDQGHTDNTIDKYFSTLKTFMNWSLDRNYTQNEAFIDFTTTY